MKQKLYYKIKENNTALVQAKQQLQNAVNQVPSTTGMTQQTVTFITLNKQQLVQNSIMLNM